MKISEEYFLLLLLIFFIYRFFFRRTSLLLYEESMLLDATGAQVRRVSFVYAIEESLPSTKGICPPAGEQSDVCTRKEKIKKKEPPSFYTSNFFIY